MVRLGLAALLAVSAVPAVGQSESYKELARQGLLVSKPIVVQRYGATELQSGELRVPTGKGPFPVAMVIHGGCWLNNMGDQTNTSPLADALTKRGIATWNIGYRRVGDTGGGWPGTFEDIATAADHLRVLAKSYPLDLTSVALIGHSSGAHLALWAASRPKLNHAVAGKSPVKFISVFAIDGPGSLAPFVGVDEKVCGQPVIARLMGGAPSERVAEYRLASPADHLPLGVPTYLVMGDLDPFMTPYSEQAKAAGERIEVLSPADADHFNVITPKTTVGDQVIDLIVANVIKQ
jgi:acetyl esterase/lipase